MGGAIAAIEAGLPAARSIQDAAYRVQREIEPGSASSWASTATPTTRPSRRRSSASTRRSSTSRSRASGACARSATRPPGRPRSSGSSDAAARQRQPPARHHRRGQGARHAGRGQRPAARGVGRAPRAGDGLTVSSERGTGRPRSWTIGRPHASGRVHHVAVVVRDIDAALGIYRRPLGLPVELGRCPSSRTGSHRLPDASASRRSSWSQPTRRHDRRGALPRSRGGGLPPRLLRGRRRRRAARRARRRRGRAHRPRRRGAGAEGPVAFLHPRSCHGVLVELIEARGGPAWAPLGYDADAAPRLICGSAARGSSARRGRPPRRAGRGSRVGRLGDADAGGLERRDLGLGGAAGAADDRRRHGPSAARAAPCGRR